MTEVDARRGVPAAEIGRPKPSPVGAVDARRVAVSTALLSAGVVGVVVVVRLAPHGGPVWVAVTALLGLLVLPVVASVLEWFVHRFVYHEAVFRSLGAIFTVHTAHHFAYFPTWRYVTGGPARRLSITRRSPEAYLLPIRNARVRLAHFLWYMAIGAVVVWTPAWFATTNAGFLVGLGISTAIVSNLFIVVHDTIHRPSSHRLVEVQPWFAFLDRHHYIHHVALGNNLNFLLPLADLLFGTLRTQMTPDELAQHGSLQLAKARPVGEGERARLSMVPTTAAEPAAT